MVKTPMRTDVLKLCDLEEAQLIIICGGHLQLLLEGFCRMPRSLFDRFTEVLRGNEVVIYSWSAGTTAMGTDVTNSPDCLRRIELKSATFRLREEGIGLFPFPILVHAVVDVHKPELYALLGHHMLYVPDDVSIYVAGPVEYGTYWANCENAAAERAYNVLNVAHMETAVESA
jgi:hypothetical protein